MKAVGLSFVSFPTYSKSDSKQTRQKTRETTTEQGRKDLCEVEASKTGPPLQKQEESEEDAKIEGGGQARLPESVGSAVCNSETANCWTVEGLTISAICTVAPKHDQL
jgi:hypothetical protein